MFKKLSEVSVIHGAKSVTANFKQNIEDDGEEN
jgi:hypothetical protein